MEKKLKRLLDYQRFEKNEKLEKLIRETESRYAKELSDDDLSLVSAAGEETSPAEEPPHRRKQRQRRSGKSYLHNFQ